MAGGWTCVHCGTANDEVALTCAGCRRIRGVTSADPAVEPAAAAAVSEADAGTQQTTDAASEPAMAAGDPPAGDQAPVAWTATDAPAAPEPAPAARPIWQRIPLQWLVVGVLVVGGGVVGAIINAGRAPSGEIDKAGDMLAGDLRVGDCFDLKDPASEEIGDVTAKPCTVAHEYEVFFVADVPGSAYPAEADFETFVVEECSPAFATYVGKAYEASEFDVFWMYPNSEAWGDGDHSIQCALFHPRIHELTESQKGSNR